MEKVEFVGIDWCEDTLRKEIPEDPEQFVEVRRFTAAQRRKRQQLAGRVHVNPKEGEDDVSLEVQYDQLKIFEYENGIVDFKIKDSKGKYLTFDHHKPANNRRIYDHVTGKLEKFIDDLLTEVNKADEEVQEVEGNLEDSSETS